MSNSDLFSPFQAGALSLPNRVVMAPLTRCRALPGNVPNPLAATYYAQRAGAGLIVAEASQVVPEGQGYVRTPGIHTDAQEEGWKVVTRAVHDAGGRIVLQLWHVGRLSHPDFQPGGALPVSASAVRPDGTVHTPLGRKPYEAPRALETDEIPAIVAAYGAAAARAKRAGFDGVEIHGANGYLIDQFLRDGTNLRTDRYGGSLDNRLRFLDEVAAAVVDVWGADRVGLRISPTGEHHSMVDSDPAAIFGAVADCMSWYGLAYLHVIEPVADGHPMGPPPGKPRVAGELRRRFKGALILNGGLTRDSARQLVDSGVADLVSFGIPFISNPDLVERLRLGAPLAAADSDTFYTEGPEGYIDYPTLEPVAA